MILVDTDVLIWVLRGREDIVRRFEEALEEKEGFVFITPVQEAEIFAGARKGEESLINSFLSSLKNIPIDSESGRRAGEYLAKYGKSHGTTLADAFVAAVASVNGLKLWTLNRKHFPMLKREDFFS